MTRRRGEPGQGVILRAPVRPAPEGSGTRRGSFQGHAGARPCSRRSFLRAGAGAAAGLGLAGCGGSSPSADSIQTAPSSTTGPGQVSIVRAASYDAVEVHEALARSFELIGGIQELVRGRRVAIKVNLTGFARDLFGHPPGEAYATHDATVHALARHLFASGAVRVSVVESASFRGTLEDSASGYGWNVPQLRELGVELENTRNLGLGSSYARFPVPGGRLFTYFDLNHAYADHDVIVSLAKMKNHVTAGVTLSMKNLFGLTPNSLYGVEAPDEDAQEYRGVLHRRAEGGVLELPGEIPGFEGQDEYFRIPNIVTDLNAARPSHLSIIDGLTTVSGGEGPWNPSLQWRQPGVIVSGFDAVSTDAVATAVMGYPDPLTPRGRAPFAFCENHLLLAHQAGLGNGDLASIAVAGEDIASVRQRFAWL